MARKGFIITIFSILLISGLYAEDIQKETSMTVSFNPGSSFLFENLCAAAICR